MTSDNLFARLKTSIEAPGRDLPLHRRLKIAIEAAIRDNTLKPGSMLPGERVISEYLALSRVTVRKSIATLVEEGLLHRRHGFRTEVGAPRVEKSLSALTSFSDDMLARGLSPGCLWISKQMCRPSPAEMMALGISADMQVVRMKRIRTADGLPIAVETSAVPVKFLPSPDLVGDSLYAVLALRGALPQRAIQRMRSRAASHGDAGYLDCEIGAPLLVTERRCFLSDEQIVEFCETRYKGDVYDFVFEMKR